MDDKIKVFIVSDAVIARTMLKRLIEDVEDIEVVGEETTGPAGVIMLEELMPQVVLLEVGISGGMKLSDIIKQMLLVDENIKIILLSDIRHADGIMAGTDIGAVDFLIRPYKKENVVRSILEAVRGEREIEF